MSNASVVRDMGAGGRKKLEPIERVIDRCRFRLDRSLDVNVADVIRLIDEIEKREHERKAVTLAVPLWHGLGTGD